MLAVNICGNDPEAEREVGANLDRFGWETADMGTAGLERDRALCDAVVIPGILRNEWSHAFALLRPA